MIVEERELTDYGHHPFVGPMPHCVIPVPAVVPADPDVSWQAVFPGPWGEFC